jgi:excisionase family DNA binding protein
MATATAATRKQQRGTEPLISVVEAAARLGVDKKTVYQLIDAKQLEAINMFQGVPGHKPCLRIEPAEIARFLGRAKTKAANTNGTDDDN